ncbi:hypothetical protein ACFQPF_12450 [Fictibacillus iocasae]|uniref:DUF5067 domain-containing protein n=1 Tax=Fictibacillus iocasae TaxID=2715437 RepID=A0ABW2NV08_9BACL
MKAGVHMKRSLILIGLVLLISGLWFFNFIRDEGEFTKWSHASVGKGVLIESKAVYIGYHFRWDGIGKPTIEKVELLKRDGSEDAKVELYMSNKEIGTYDEEDAIKEGIIQTLFPVKGFTPDTNFFIVLRVGQGDIQSDQDIRKISITYTKFGQSHVQTLSFEDGVISD